MLSSGEIVRRAWRLGRVIPAFNIPYLPMMEPVVRAVLDTDSVALIEVARLEWMKFEAGSPRRVMEEYAKWANPAHVRIHLDHVPVIDEDGKRVDYVNIIREAIDAGYQSVMVDGSRLDLDGNIAATSQVVELAHHARIACEAELGSVLGHADGPLPPYDELFATCRGFTDIAQARRFARDTQCDWLSVAFGSIHGAISKAARDQKKVEARLNLTHLEQLRQATQIPLVLHGGSGVRQDYVLAAVERGIAKINVGTEIRQAYEAALRETKSVPAAQQKTYDRTASLITDYFGMAGIRAAIMGDAP
ncbi:MAG: class II fructose-bisphosphate aldolase [Candidatus Hydrogenedentes bacterium]|nr:class II fructose-bisphosphate aldolase [Candidatus Hydrogenedentota bacterium]